MGNNTFTLYIDEPYFKRNDTLRTITNEVLVVKTRARVKIKLWFIWLYIPLWVFRPTERSKYQAIYKVQLKR